MIQLTNIAYSIGGSELLQDISLTVSPGEMVAVIGANGAGKSTLMRILSGLIRPSRGSLSLDGKDLFSYSAEEMARRRAVLDQQSVLTFGFSALEVVMMGRTPHMTGARKNLEISLEAMKTTGTDHLAGRSYPTLSGGEQQRVHLARALAQIWEPVEGGERYLFLDEPTSYLDLAHQHMALSIASRCTQAGLGVLAVLHDLNLAANHANRVAVLKKGRLTAVGTPEETLTPEVLRDAFGIETVVSRHPATQGPLIVALHQPNSTQNKHL